jgi:hypothetical protein
MGNILRRTLIQSATLWVVSPNPSGGDLFSTPVLIKCRWEDKTELYIGQLDRRERVSAAIVHIDRPVSVGDYLALDDQTFQLDPTLIAGAYKVQRFQQVSDLRNLEIINKAIL